MEGNDRNCRLSFPFKLLFPVPEEPFVLQTRGPGMLRKNTGPGGVSCLDTPWLLLIPKSTPAITTLLHGVGASLMLQRNVH
jgi:hypothetical protein